MLDKINDNSSSSEDEISKNALKEATDHQFFKDSYFSSQKSSDLDASGKSVTENSLIKNEDSKPVSLRKDLDQQERFSNFGVSPSFQSYVAKKLDEIIEKSIKIKKKETNNLTNHKEDKNDHGIRLLSSSGEFLTGDEELHTVQRKRKIESTIDEKGSLLKCKEVAVESDRILSKEETKAWTSKRGKPEFKYKRMKNGTLIEET